MKCVPPLPSSGDPGVDSWGIEIFIGVADNASPRLGRAGIVPL